MKTVSNINGHIILYCKGQYNIPNVDLITGFQRLWACICGFDIEQINKDSLPYIARRLYDIIKEVSPERLEPLHRNILLEEITKDYLTRYENLSAIEKIITIYRDELAWLQTKERNAKTGRYSTLIKLPKPQKRICKRIIKGEIKPTDYKIFLT